jgi:exodeoxyribonuclease VII large subunit
MSKTSGSSPKSYSLLELCRSVQKGIEDRYTGQYWVRAEMSKLNYYSHNGHCYPDLVERIDGRVVAQMRSTIWKLDYERLNRMFLQSLNEPLKDGIKILFRARVAYNPVHGLTLQITDIDPQYTLGDLEREKRDNIRRLTEEGMLDKNKSLKLAHLPQRLAIISVQTSKGYADFMSKIQTAGARFGFFHMLFPAILQGETAVRDIGAALHKIDLLQQHFDAVVIVRGGGGDVGLAAYNNYDMSAAICRFPLPVLTGIGHRANNTVAEMCAFHSAITPTDIADFLIRRMEVAEDQLHTATTALSDLVGDILTDNSRTLQQQTLRMQSRVRQTLHVAEIKVGDLKSGAKSATAKLLLRNKLFLDNTPAQIKRELYAFFRTRWAYISERKKNIDHLHPDSVLKRGYSITRLNGRAITQTTDILPGTEITSWVAGGTLTSTVNKITAKNKNAKGD